MVFDDTVLLNGCSCPASCRNIKQERSQTQIGGAQRGVGACVGMGGVGIVGMEVPSSVRQSPRWSPSFSWFVGYWEVIRQRHQREGRSGHTADASHTLAGRHSPPHIQSVRVLSFITRPFMHVYNEHIRAYTYMYSIHACML